MMSSSIIKAIASLSILIVAPSIALETVKLSHPYGSNAEVFLFGAQVKSFYAAMDTTLDILFMSEDSPMDGVNPISGGIPIVFPNFADATGLPFHGFARTTNWTLVSYVEAPNGTSASVATFLMASSSLTRAIWPVDFELVYEVKLYANQLQTALHVHNTFTKTIEFHALLHNYLRVDDVRNNGVQVMGLEGVDYYDKVTKDNKTETREYINFVNMTDNVYKNAPDVVTVHIKGVKAEDRTITVQKAGFISSSISESNVETLTDVVVWNPWIERAKAMTDLGDDEYIRMITVEPGRVSEKQSLPAGKTFTLQQTISVTTL